MSTCPQVGPMFNEGKWNAQKKAWESRNIPRTREGEEAHYTAFLLGAPYLQAVLHYATNLAFAPCLHCLVHFIT